MPGIARTSNQPCPSMQIAVTHLLPYAYSFKMSMYIHVCVHLASLHQPCVFTARHQTSNIYASHASTLDLSLSCFSIFSFSLRFWTRVCGGRGAVRGSPITANTLHNMHCTEHIPFEDMVPWQEANTQNSYSILKKLHSGCCTCPMHGLSQITSLSHCHLVPLKPITDMFLSSSHVAR